MKTRSLQFLTLSKISYRINFCITLRVYVKILYIYIYQKSKEQRRNGFGVFYFFLHYHKCYPALDLHSTLLYTCIQILQTRNGQLRIDVQSSSPVCQMCAKSPPHHQPCESSHIAMCSRVFASRKVRYFNCLYPLHADK